MRLTDDPGDDTQPNWSPDGTKIVFVSNRDGNDEIYVMDADGQNAEQITDVPEPDLDPVWSPDGTQIVFTSGRAAAIDVWVMDADGGNARKLAGGKEPDWFDPAFVVLFSVSFRGKLPLAWGWLKRSE
jgi:Tol biopolymer transport system component